MDSSAPRKSPQRRPPPPHLQEFYSFVDGQGDSPAQLDTSTLQSDVPNVSTSNSLFDFAGMSLEEVHQNIHSQKLRSDSFLSSQPSMTPSTLDLETLITKKDFNDTIGSCRDLVRTAAAYRDALVALGTAASEFGRSLEDCARCKGAGATSEGLMTASGFHHQIANHQQILAHSLSTGFERPVSEIISNFERTYKENDTSFKKEIKDKITQLRHKEAANHKLSRKKTRNIIAYKSNLLQLASQLDEIDRAKHDYYVSSYEQTQSAFARILGQTSSVVAMETQMYDNIARKALAGGGLDKLLDDSRDINLEESVASENATLEAVEEEQGSPSVAEQEQQQQSPKSSRHLSIASESSVEEADKTADTFFSPPVVKSRGEEVADTDPDRTPTNDPPDHSSTFSLPTATSSSTPVAPTVTRADSVNVVYI
ncbi:hypothetical protein OGAPHI_003845 [Ogataea philodendri]|uniref:Protein IVY1 n=1 Tax=Ogataea philodendri TaxID=1378263 RepID=A0A9P8P5L4_9ASCO|nr:uncharacterized protein OGAPHI_003845 [Ogataea philodendri]KAH3665657.1 hypothetical protein OGAPHI_003845 [Ogataea philodendri]